MITDHFFPDWGIWDRYICTFKHPALNRDSLKETFPIELTNESADNDLSVATSDIIYTKGASILLMMKGYLGEDTFKTCVNHFLNKHKFSNASSQDYWIAFEEVLEGPIVDIMKSWVHQPGHPIVGVKKDGNNLLFSQERFTFVSNKSNQLWKIPLTIAVYDKQGNKGEIKTVLIDKSISITIPETSHSFVVNNGQTGFYRVRYEQDTLEKTGPLITKKILASNDRYGIQNDLFALVKCGEYSIDQYFDFLNNYENEDSYAPLTGICNNLLEAFLILDSKRDMISSIGTKIAGQCISKIKIHPQEGESHSTQILRNQLLWTASYFGDEKVTSLCLELFKNFMAGESIDANILESVLKIGASQNSGCYDFLISKFESPVIEETEKINILRALGCFKDRELLLKSLEYVLDKVPLKNKLVPILSAAGNLVIMRDMWQWFLENIKKIEKFHPFHFQIVISSLVPVSGVERPGEVKQFFEEYMKGNKGNRDTIKMALEKLDVNCRLRNNNGM
jgi:aminopeptidase N